MPSQYLDTFLFLDLAVVISITVVDLMCNRERRVNLLHRLSGSWTYLREISFVRLIADQSARYCRLMASVFIGRARTLYFLGLSLVATTLTSGVALVLGAMLIADEPQRVIVHAVKHFGVPTVACGWLALILTSSMLHFARCHFAPAMKSMWLIVYFFLLVGLWVALMHIGTWLEWRETPSPVGYGTEWFYAQVYLEYFREPAGMLISVITGLVILSPILALLGWLCLLAIAKLLQPVLEPASTRFLTYFKSYRRGVLAACAITLGIVVKVLHHQIKTM